MKKERNTSLDLLRVFLTLFVVVLHFNNKNWGAAMDVTTGIWHEMTLLAESICICAVNTFMIESGYFSINSNRRKISKVVYILASLAFYNIVFYLISNIGSFRVKKFVLCFVPMNYYICLYSAVYLLSPWINEGIKNISKRNFQLLLLILFVLFSVWPTITDTYTGITGNGLNGASAISLSGNGGGYTIVQFIFDYCLGAYIRRFGTQNSKQFCFVAYLLMTGITFALYHVTYSAIDYDNLAVVLSSYYLFCFFTKINISKNNIISYLAGKSLDVYLIHGHLFFLCNLVSMQKLLNGPGFLLCYPLTCILIYVISIGIGSLCGLILKPLNRLINKSIRANYAIEYEQETSL